MDKMKMQSANLTDANINSGHLLLFCKNEIILFNQMLIVKQ